MSQVKPVRVVCELGAGENIAHTVVAEPVRRVEPTRVAFATLAQVRFDFLDFF